MSPARRSDSTDDARPADPGPAPGPEVEVPDLDPGRPRAAAPEPPVEVAPEEQEVS